MKYMFIAFLLSSAQAFASSACVTYVDNTGSSTVKVQASCDGAELSELFTAKGLTAGMSKAIQHFTDQGYTFMSCSEAYNPGGTNGAGSHAYARCTFVKK